MRPLIVLVLLLGASYGGMQILSQMQRQEVQVGAGLKRVEVTATAVQSFDDKLSTLEKAADDARRTGRAAAVEVTFTEQELTSKLAEVTASAGGIAATDTQIHFAGGNVLATSKVTFQGIDLTVGIVATPVVEAGRARLVVKELQTGSVPIPDALRQQLQAQLTQAIDSRSLGLPFDISSVRIVDGKVVISGTATP